MKLHDPKRILLRHKLIEHRHEKKLTQTQLASKLHLPQSFVSKYESGERKLDVVDLIEVLHALGCSPVDFFRNYYTEFNR